MKIAVVGCGALGSYYGAKLCRAGHEVHFLLRSDYDAVRQDGVTIESPEGDFRVQPDVRPRARRKSGHAELVLIGLKTTANATLPQLLPPLAGPDTASPDPAKRPGQRSRPLPRWSARSGPWVDFALSV